MKTHRIPLSKDSLTTLGFADFFHYHESFFWKWFLSVVGIAAFGFFTLNQLLDPNFHFQDHWIRFRCHGKGCGVALLIYVAALVFFSLPLWLKLPSAIVFAINSVFGFSKKMVHYYDQKPDFAVGEAGIYCPDWFHYQEVSWPEIKHIIIKRYKNQYGDLLSQKVSIELRNKELADLAFFARTERKLNLSPTWKLKTAAIVQSLRKFGLNTKFIETDEVIHIKER
jgi:hypothetical protein